MERDYELIRKLGGMAVNGRIYYFNFLSNLRRVPGSRSRWLVERRGTTYHIEGGRHAGGSRREWFVEGGDFNGPINTTSLVDSLRLLDTM